MIEVDRRQPAPSSLLGRTTWTDEDVLDALHEDFLEKCYLCEAPIPPRQFEVDHRHQQKWPGGEALKFAWDNLFPAHADCNNRRLAAPPPAGLLDPCTERPLVARLVQAWHRDEPRFAEVTGGDAQASATADELRHLHWSGAKATNLRRAIREQLYVVRGIERDLLDPGLSDVDRKLKREQLRRLVSRRAPFTTWVRQDVLACHHHLFD